MRSGILCGRPKVLHLTSEAGHTSSEFATEQYSGHSDDQVLEPELVYHKCNAEPADLKELRKAGKRHVETNV